jgi:hypothetical protein
MRSTVSGATYTLINSMGEGGFKLGVNFPREGFVQATLESQFSLCERLEVGWADFACVDHQGRRWVIEAKGETSSSGLDFRTGLGQLLQNMGDSNALYGMAVPDTPKFEAQLARVPDWVRSALGLHWLIVAEDGSLRIEPPPKG